MTKPILIVITRQNRAERPSEAVLDATTSGLVQAADANQLANISTWDEDTFIKTVPRRAGDAGIAAEIARISRTRYSPAREKADEGLAIYEYSCQGTGRTEARTKTIPEHVEPLSGETIPEQILKEVFTVRGTKELDGDSNKIFNETFDDLADARAFIDTLHPSDGYDLLGDISWEQIKTEVLETRPCLWNIPDRQLFNAPVKNAFPDRQSEEDRH